MFPFNKGVAVRYQRNRTLPMMICLSSVIVYRILYTPSLTFRLRKEEGTTNQQSFENDLSAETSIKRGKENLTNIKYCVKKSPSPINNFLMAKTIFKQQNSFQSLHIKDQRSRDILQII